jgi:hypothetical protein
MTPHQERLLATLDPGRKDHHLEHGTRGSYMAGCKCRLCLRAHADYQRAYNARRRQA